MPLGPKKFPRNKGDHMIILNVNVSKNVWVATEKFVLNNKASIQA